jgi:hypothetical protein
MNISEVVVEGFRGLKIATRLKRVNIVVGENVAVRLLFLNQFLCQLFSNQI